MELHHDKHHATYVKGLNEPWTSWPRPATRVTSAPSSGWRRPWPSTSAGTSTTPIFWKNLSPDGGDKPDGELGAALDDAFGSFDAFQRALHRGATTIQGSGWAILGWDALAGSCWSTSCTTSRATCRPGRSRCELDMWEHAFYLQYKNVKPDYVKAWWNVVNWADAQARFDAARAGAANLVTGA